MVQERDEELDEQPSGASWSTMILTNVMFRADNKNCRAPSKG